MINKLIFIENFRQLYLLYNSAIIPNANYVLLATSKAVKNWNNREI